MKNTLLCSLIAIGIISCTNHNEDINFWLNENSKHVLDTLGKAYLGSYAEPQGFFVLVIDSTQTNKALKLSYRKGFPLYIDTLLFIKPNEYRSEREKVTCLVKDTCLITLRYAKIIHPSSNWQGQTPWVQPYVEYYKRLDN